MPLVVALVLAASVLLPARPAVAVVGGSHAADGQFPFVASMDGFGCTGSLIAPTWVLTAAHCNEKPFVRIGTTQASTGGELVAVKRAIRHPGYHTTSPTPPYLANDLMLFELATPATSPVVRVARPDEPALQGPGRTATDIGYGLACDPVDPNVPDCVDFESLRYGSFPIIDTPTCQGAEPTYAAVDAVTMVCTLHPGGGVSPCYGDSGGPLVVDDAGTPVQIGVVSGGLDPCGRPDGPAVYTRVSAFAQWLTDETGIDFVHAQTATTTTTSTSTSTTTTSSTSVPATEPTTAPATPAAVPVVVATPRFTG